MSTDIQHSNTGTESIWLNDTKNNTLLLNTGDMGVLLFSAQVLEMYK